MWKEFREFASSIEQWRARAQGRSTVPAPPTLRPAGGPRMRRKILVPAVMIGIGAVVCVVAIGRTLAHAAQQE